MPRLDIADIQRYEVAAIIAESLGATIDSRAQTITAPEPLSTLIMRIVDNNTVVLPIRAHDHDTWLIAGALRRDLDANFAEVCRFVVPTYAEFDGGFLSHTLFDPHGDRLNQLGSVLYPAGYYRLRAPSTHFTIISARLARWSTLARTRPLPRIVQTASYRDLFDAFNAALAAGAWEHADQQVREIQQRGLTSADNLAYLQVHLLAQQQRWAELWQRQDYGDIARLRSPRAVRLALLTAFHQSELLAFEQTNRWHEALEHFRRSRARLGRLIEGACDAAYGPVVRVHAYREAAAGNAVALAALPIHPDDDETRQIVAALAGMVTPVPVTPPIASVALPLTPHQAFRTALDNDDYATALQLAAMFTTPGERARSMLEVAFFSADPSHAEAALLQFWSLPQSEQDELQRQRRLSQIISALSAEITPPSPTPAPASPITDWLDWFIVANENRDDPRLKPSLSIVAAADDRYWTAERVTLLAEPLVTFVTGGVVRTRSYGREVIHRLCDHFLRDHDFPHDDSTFVDVYEALYLGLLEQPDVNETTALALFRLAEARLRRNPILRDGIARDLCAWFAEPIPAMAHVALELLDLLAAYGIQGPALSSWYRGWVEALLAMPRQLDRLTLESWLLFGEWVQPGADLLNAMHQRLAAQGDQEDDPVAALPDNYRIGIFILSADRATRVADMLHRRNARLDIQICDDSVLTERARTLAQSADMAVVVTGCVKHALTYGIASYLHNPVYPASVGSTSILRAIEQRLQKG